jgi:hypothetical protein
MIEPFRDIRGNRPGLDPRPTFHPTPGIALRETRQRGPQEPGREIVKHDPHRVGSIAMQNRPSRLDESNPSVLKGLAIRWHQGRRVLLPLPCPALESIVEFLQGDSGKNAQRRICQFVIAPPSAPERRSSELGS